MSEDDKIKLRKDLLWGLYQEHRVQMRHTETIRQSATTVIFAISAGLVTAIGIGNIDQSDTNFALAIIAVGIIGLLFNIAYTTRYTRSRLKALVFLKEIDKLIVVKDPFKSLFEIEDAEDSRLDKDDIFMRMTKKGRGAIWIILPVFIIVAGVLLYYDSKNASANSPTPSIINNYR